MMGHNPTMAIRDFTGQMEFDPAALDQTTLAMTVRADALQLADTVSPKDRLEIESRMRQEVLETASYPDIAFRSTRVNVVPGADYSFSLQIVGELQLHGLTGILPIDAQMTLFTDGLRLSGAFSLLLSTYRLKRVAALGGLIKLKDDLKFMFDLIGRPISLS